MTARELGNVATAERPLTYANYLQTGVLLSLQKTQVPATAGRAVTLAEHFFIVTHQSCELWLKQVLADLDAAVDALSPPCGPDDVELSAEFLQRADELLQLLHAQLMALERLPVQYFAAFRPYLGTASGAQSPQFRMLSRVMGSERQPSRLYEAFTAAAAHHGLSVAEVCRLGVRSGALHRVAEAMLEVGNGYWRWKVAHLALVTMMVGGQEGTGGSTGADYLARRVTQPFTELRALRGRLHGGQ